MLSSLPVEVYVVAFVLTVGLLVYLGLGRLEEQKAARSSLRQLDDFNIENQREKDLLDPLTVRMFGPLVRRISSFGSRFNPPEYVASVRKKFLSAGIQDELQVERFLALRILMFALVPVWIAVVMLFNPFGLSGMLKLILAGLGSAVLLYGPTARLNSKVAERQLAIQRSLPDVLDLLVISVEAGLGFEQAIDRVITNVPGPLSIEFARVLGETNAGSTRADALRGMQERVDVPEVRSFVMSMIQADRFGVSIGRVLRSQADEMRVKRRQLAQERAQKAPVKMLIPMVFCIFPALFVVILGPALINISENLG